MSERGLKKLWVDTMVASGALNKWGIVNLSNSNTVIAPSATATKPFGVALDDAADGETVPILRIGRCYVIDHAGSLNNGDYISGCATSGSYFEVIAATVGTTAGVFGRVVGDDASTAADLVLADLDFTRHDK